MIPIENIYFLLCYAWDKLEERRQVIVSFDATTNLLDLLAKVLINGCKRLLKKGVAKNYLAIEGVVNGIKGKLDISQTAKQHLLLRKKAHCEFDELSSDILLNSIILSTLINLCKTDNLDRGLKSECVKIIRMLDGIQSIVVTEKTFGQLKFSRSQKFYQFLINVCELIFQCSLLNTITGKYQFMEFFQDEKRMNKLFEAFVRNFYKIEMGNVFNVRRETIYWKLIAKKSAHKKYLPQMQTDITLENKNQKIIIDTKYYKEAFAKNFDSEKIHSAHLFQIYSYLDNQITTDFRTKEAIGILLYPTVNQDLDLEYQHNRHAIRICTVNLNTNWQIIVNRLKEVVFTSDTDG